MGKDERNALLSKFATASCKKVANIVMGEPKQDFKKWVQEVMLKDKQERLEREWKERQAEKQRKREMDKKQKQIEDARKQALETAAKLESGNMAEPKEEP